MHSKIDARSGWSIGNCSPSPRNQFQGKTKEWGGEESWNLKFAGGKFRTDKRKCSFTQQGTSFQNSSSQEEMQLEKQIVSPNLQIILDY